MTHAIAKIEVIKTTEGFKVYGRMGAVMVADSNRRITYSNINPEAQEYPRMERKLKEFKV